MKSVNNKRIVYLLELTTAVLSMKKKDMHVEYTFKEIVCLA